MFPAGEWTNPKTTGNGKTMYLEPVPIVPNTYIKKVVAVAATGTVGTTNYYLGWAMLLRTIIPNLFSAINHSNHKRQCYFQPVAVTIAAAVGNTTSPLQVISFCHVISLYSMWPHAKTLDTKQTPR